MNAQILHPEIITMFPVLVNSFWLPGCLTSRSRRLRIHFRGGRSVGQVLLVLELVEVQYFVGLNDFRCFLLFLGDRSVHFWLPLLLEQSNLYG